MATRDRLQRAFPPQSFARRVGIVAGVGIPVGLAITAFILWVFPPLYAAVWGATCSTVDVWLVCSGFLQRGFTAGILIGVTAPVVGAYLVNRQMALIGEALAHTAFGGVRSGCSSAPRCRRWTTPSCSRSSRPPSPRSECSTSRSTPTGTPTSPSRSCSPAGSRSGSRSSRTASFSARPSRATSSATSSSSRFQNVQLMVGLTLLVAGTVAVTHKQLLFITFDREAARLARIDVWFYDTLLIVLTALVVVAAMQVLGAILVAGMLVIPVAAAMQVTGSFNGGLLLSVAFGQVAVIGGILASAAFNIARGRRSSSSPSRCTCWRCSSDRGDGSRVRDTRETVRTQ